MDTRRLILALFAAFAVYVAYQWLYTRFNPPKPKPAVVSPLPGIPTPDGGEEATTQAATAAAAASSPAAPVADFSFAAAPAEQTLALGGGPDDTLLASFTSRGAALMHLRLTERDKRGQYVHRMGPKTAEPYQLLGPIDHNGVELPSFDTTQLFVDEHKKLYSLAGLLWDVLPIDSAGRSVSFRTTLRAKDTGDDLLQITKTYTLGDKPQLINLALTLENLGDKPLSLYVEQTGPLGIHQDDRSHDMCRLLAARRTPDGIKTEATQRAQLVKLTEPRRFLGSGQEPEKFLWTALSNKYFAVVTRPLATSGDAPGYVAAVTGAAAAPELSENPGDLLARIVSNVPKLLPGAQNAQRFTFEIYAGPKDGDVLERTNPAYVDSKQLGYTAVHDADTQCACTFQPLPTIMSALLEGIHSVVRNYGIAIIVLVLIVRTILHPLAVFQQKSMYRMQEAMARVQPKLEILKERYANDKVRLNQEMMKLWAEEHVNPAAGMVAFIPLFLQMPILVALWTALNSDIHLRNAPFDGWWIVDLSAPDALIHFSGAGIHIPLLSFITGNITSLNLLPILMGVSMYLQQKYMPKPAMAAKLEAAKQHPPKERKPGTMTPEEQMRQQQLIGYMMCFLFPLMFYHMPSGLVLYWMATNIFGIFESLIIRKQLREEKERREREGPRPIGPRKPGIMARFMKRIAEQAEELQRKADDLTHTKKK